MARIEGTTNRMPKVVILGTASFIPDETHDNAHMLLQGENGSVLIDSGNNPLVSLKRAGLSADRLHTMILTHFHPDHVSGVPNFLMGLWLMGRTQPLSIHGLNVTLEKIQALMSLFEWKDWPGFYPVTFEPAQSIPGLTILETSDFSIQAAPTHHLVPSLALKVTARPGGKTLVYSSDTSPCDTVAQLARGADILIHEVAGAASGHSSAAMAGSIARQSGVGRLALIHYHTYLDPQDLIAEAHSTFSGPVTVLRDLDVIEL
jgi:ribonuclease Z